MKEEITETHKKIQELEANGGTVAELWLLFKTRLSQSVIDHIPHKTAKQKDGNGKCSSIWTNAMC